MTDQPIKHYAYGHFGLNPDRSFDTDTALNYHHDPYEMLNALNLVADDMFKEKISVDQDQAFLENYANLWTSFKYTMRRNIDIPFQQIVAPDGRIYWWLKLV